MLKQLKQRLVEHENIMTVVLITVAVVLLAVAIFGRTEHKLMACVYIVL